MDLFWAFVVVATLLGLWIQNGGPTRAKNEGLLKSSTAISNQTLISNKNNPGSSNSVNDSGEEIVYSPYRGKIRISTGTAASTYQPNREYIILSAGGNEEPISIGGWTLKNGRSKQLYVVNGNTVRGQSVSIKLPTQGIALYDPYHPLNNKRSSLTLKSGERAIITTGNSTVLSGATVRDNFKLNRCLGYLEDDRGYLAYPSLRYNCPSSNEVPGITELDNVCYDFARSISPCHVPKDIYVKNEGYCLERNCKLSSYCRQFIKDNYNFDTCFALYSEDKDFVGPEWRVFLNRTWELWADRRETISLYDRAGLLVDEVNY